MGGLLSRTASVLITATLAAGTVAATAGAADAGIGLGSCSAQGDFAICDASGTATRPVTITVTVTASPNQQVFVSWDDTCSVGTSAGGKSGSFTAQTPVTRTISHPWHQPDMCIVAAGAQLQAGGNSVHVSLSYSRTAPPASHEIKGYAGKCADDSGNSSANGAKVIIWTCNSHDKAQSWAYSGSKLVHNGKCLNDPRSGGNGTKVILYTCNGGANEIWTHKANGEFVLKANGGKYCLDDPAYSKTNGTQLVVYRCSGGANQKWTLP